MQAAVTGKSVKEYASLFDSVYVSLYKYLGTPFGSILAGEADFIEGMFHERRMFGGGLANSSLIAALALNGLNGFEAKFSESITKANQLFNSLNDLEHIQIHSFEHGSNIHRLILNRELSIETFISSLKTSGIFVYTEPSNEIYLHVNATILQQPNSGIISAICNVTASLARKVYDDFQNKKKQTFNEKLCAVRKVFDNYNLISALHSFMSVENKKYKRVLPPLNLLTEEENKMFMSKLEELDFFPEKNIAA